MTDLPAGSGYLLIVVLALAGLVLLYWPGRRRRSSRHDRRQAQARRVLEKLTEIPHFGQKFSYLRKIDPFTFEELLLEAFERRGYEVIRNARYTGDGGIDGRVIINDEVWFIQAKRYTDHIAIGHVRDFQQLLDASQCRGFFCHTGKTREGTRSHIRSDGRVVLISGQRLLDLITTDAPFSVLPD